MNLYSMNSVDREEEVDSPKKIYLGIQETVKQVEVASSRCVKIEDLFSSDLLSKRNKIKELCDKLLYDYSLKTYGSFAREKLWKYVFYEPITRARKMHQREKSWSILQLAYVKSHLLNGIGILKMLLLKIQEHPEFMEDPLLSRPNSLEGILYEDMVLIEKSREPRELSEKKDNKWLVELMYMCLINIGDLYRYLTDIYSKISDDLDESMTYFNRAMECYTQAFLIHPVSGLALNQLGNLHADKNWGIDATYYFLYSTLTEKAYEGAFPNVRQLLDKKLVHFARLPASVQPNPMEILCNGFMSMLYHLLCEESQLKNYEKFCQETLSNFHERLVTYDPELDDQLLFKFSSISVMAVRRLQMSNSVNTPAAVGFAMSVFFQLVYQIGVILEEHAHLEVIPSKLAEDQTEVSISEDEDFLIEKQKRKHSSNVTKPKHKPRMGMRRGPRKNGRESIPSLHSDESESEETESDQEIYSENEDDYWSVSEDESDFSNEEEEEEEYEKEKANGKAFDSSSSNGRSDSLSGGSGGNSQKSGEELSQTLPEEFREGTPNLVDISELKPTVEEDQRLVFNPEGLMKCKSQVEALLVAMTPFIRCLQTCPEIKDAFAANAEKLFLEKLCGILTLLTSCDWPNMLDKVQLQSELKADWKNLLLEDSDKKNELSFRWELPEDRSMLGLPLLKENLSGLVINDELSDNDKLIIRIGRLVSFGKWMIDSGSFSMLYIEDQKAFVVPSQQMFMERLRFNKIKRLIDGKTDSESMLKLSKAYKEMSIRNGGRGKRDRRRRRPIGGNFDQSEPPRRKNGMTRKTRVGEGGPAPLLIVVDLSACLYKIENVKRLACNKNFIVFVPGSVYKTLDMLKDTEETGSEEARVAFCWIENANRRNHPGIQILREEEKGIPQQEPDTSNLDTWDFFHMIDCCKYLIKDVISQEGRYPVQNVFKDYRDKQNIFYLTGNDSLLDGSFKKEFDPIKSARSVGVYVDNIKTYPPAPRRERRKWKTSGKFNG